MDRVLLYALTGVALLGLGLHGLVAAVHPLRRIMAMNVMGVGIFAILLAFARRNSADPADPVPHALVLTGIVVAVAVTAFAVALVRRLEQATDEEDEP